MTIGVPEVKAILLSDLLLDTRNPRLPEQASTIATQVAAIEAMIKAQGKKIVKLAADIVANGINIAELPIVIPSDKSKGQYIVMEGNRRVTLLKLLATPELLPNTISSSIIRRFRDLSKDFQKAPITSLSCVVFQTREEADPWVELRHNGESEGAGIVAWGARERAAFAARRSGKKLGWQT